MKFFNPIPISFLIGMLALAALVWFGIAYLVADTGYPGGISARDEQLIYATVSFILGMAGWLVVWRREVFVKDLGVTVRGRWAVFWGFVTVALFWGAGVWFLVQAFN